MSDLDISSLNALVFDVFGTVVDWRTTIIREGELLNRAKGLTVNWNALADDWRAGYQPAMQRVRSGDLAWTRIDELHRMILDDLLEQYGLTNLTEQEIDRLNLVWHRLLPWPDAVPGINRLRCRYVVATLSNGNISLLVHMAKNAGLPWDCVLSAELFHRYKPDPAVYVGAADLLGHPPERVMMVAAHPSDLHAAQGAGLRTAYVARPLEYGPMHTQEPVDSEVFDLVADDFLDLAAQLRT